MAEPRIIKVNCPDCNRGTNHIVLECIHRSGDDEANGIHWCEDNQIVQCQGCDCISFRKAFESSEDFDPITGDALITETLYPERRAGRAPIADYVSFPSKTRQVYMEVLKALNAGAALLAAAGLRAVIESVCNEQHIQGRNLEVRIDSLAKEGLLSAKQAAFLHAHRFLGNSAVHEIEAPKPSELIAALDIAETLLETIYSLPHLAASINTGNKSRKGASEAPQV